MARVKSAVLSPTDKKAVIKDLKGKLKVVNAAIKAKEKAQATADKNHAKESAARAKELDRLNKDAAKLQAQLDAIASVA